eukprot:SAG11_NODE_2731_length_3037_cov_3.144997_2_plen_161_part_00
MKSGHSDNERETRILRTLWSAYGTVSTPVEKSAAKMLLFMQRSASALSNTFLDTTSSTDASASALRPNRLAYMHGHPAWQAFNLDRPQRPYALPQKRYRCSGHWRTSRILFPSQSNSIEPSGKRQRVTATVTPKGFINRQVELKSPATETLTQCGKSGAA